MTQTTGTATTARLQAQHQTRWDAQRRRAWIMFLLPALVIYTLFMAYPLVNSMRLSFYTGEGLTPDRYVGLENYVELFTNPLWRDRLLNALGNNFVFFAIHMLVQNTLGLLFATLLSSPHLRGRNIYRTIIFIPATLSVLVTGFLWTLILNPRWGMLNQILEAIGLGDLARPWLGDANLALPAISLVSSWQWVGLPTMMFLAGLLTIPDELSEAARVDGASGWQIFWRIKFPLLRPVIGLVSILTFIGNFNAFDVIFAMAGARGEPGYATDLMATFFYRTAIAGEHPVAQPNMGIGAAVATVTFAILLTGVLIWLVWGRGRDTEEVF
ncbi:MAG: sugar ABC transporter permease [Anaerolineae bacterium]|nr:sugar ABC transporter permease [Anaerolineae bacterium]